jgi:hypothetical protein
MTQIDAYSTHLEYIQEIFNFKGRLNTVVEFGMGNYSTGLLIENADNIISIEMQSDEWYNKMVENFSIKENWKHYSLIGPFEFTKINYPEQIDLSFVDGHGGSRPECINYLMDKNCPIIVSHDTEEPGYRWNLVNDNNSYKRIDFKKYTNWTSIWTTDYDLYNNFISKNIK